MRNFKYAKRTIDRIAGVIFLLLSLFFLVVMIGMFLTGGSISTYLFLVPVVINLFAGILLLRLYMRDYISFVEDYIFIDRGFLREPFSFRRIDIKAYHISAGKMRIGLSDGREYRIVYSALSVFDVTEIEDLIVNGVI